MPARGAALPAAPCALTARQKSGKEEQEISSRLGVGPMSSTNRLTPGQWVGAFLFVLCTTIPGLSLAGFHGGTAWGVLAWLFVATVGGTAAGALLAPGHRLAGAVGGFIAGPTGLLALYFYGRDRARIFRAEAAIVQLVASLPGLGIYFILRLLTDAIFPPAAPRRRRAGEDDEDEDDRPRRRRGREEEDGSEDDRPRRRRPRDEDDAPPPRRARRRSDDD